MDIRLSGRRTTACDATLLLRGRSAKMVAMTSVWMGLVCLAVSLVAGLPADYARRRTTDYASVTQILNVLIIVGTIAGLATTGKLHGWTVLGIIVGVVLGQTAADLAATKQWGRVGPSKRGP